MMFFHTKFWPFEVEMTTIVSASIHSMKYSIATIRNFNCLVTKGNRPRIYIPHVWKGHGLAIKCNSFTGARIFSSVFLPVFLHGGPIVPTSITLRDNAHPLIWLPVVPSCSSVITLLACSNEIHLSNGWVNPCWNKYSSMMRYHSEFFLISLASLRSWDNSPFAN